MLWSRLVNSPDPQHRRRLRAWLLVAILVAAGSLATVHELRSVHTPSTVHTNSSGELLDAEFGPSWSSMTCMDISSVPFQSLKGLAGASRLRCLGIGGPPKFLLECQKCWSPRNPIPHRLLTRTDLRELQTLLDLRELNLDRVFNGRMDQLNEFGKLEALSLSRCGVLAVDRWEPPRSLRFLDLSGCHLDSVSFVSKLSHLEAIDLRSNDIRDFRPLVDLVRRRFHEDHVQVRVAISSNPAVPDMQTTAFALAQAGASVLATSKDCMSLTESSASPSS